MADMQELIARLEAAEAGSHELDRDIAIASGSTVKVWDETASDGTFLGSVRLYTTSIDAALALAERVLPEETFWEACHMGIVSGVKQYGFQLYVEDGDDEATYGHSSTPAIALCIAILKAKAQGEGG